LLLTEFTDRHEKLVLFTGIESARFRRPVVPGDQARIEVEVVNWRPRAVRMQGNVYVEGKLVCESIVMCQIVPRRRQASAGSEAPATTAAESMAQEAVSEA
jgi:3-hydroxyacyl-[acyl-carrier-protein] dehydratase